MIFLGETSELFQMHGLNSLNRKGHFDDCKVFVGGLLTTTTVDQLLAAFKAYGHVTDAMIITEKATGKPRGFAFIVFETADEVARVMAASVPWRPEV